MELIITVIQQILVAIAGLALYNIWAFKKNLKKEAIREVAFWKDFWQKSKFIWAWTLLLVLLISLTINLVEGTAEIIKNALGIDIAGNLMSFLSLGFTISAGVDTQDKPQNPK